MIVSSNTPKWAIPDMVDSGGNVACRKCAQKQSPTFKACVFCCTHDQLRFVERYECCGWELDVECDVCGKNFGFSRDDIISNYIAVRKEQPGMI